MAEHKQTAETEAAETGDLIGSQLRAQRKARGISLVEVSEHTKIGKKYLEALEEGKYDVMPCETYIRGFLRAYAKYLELDEIKLLQQYKQQNADKCEEPAEMPGEISERKNNQSVWMPLLVIVILAGLGAGLFLLWPSTPEEKTAQSDNSIASGVGGGNAAGQNAGTMAGQQLTLTIKGKEKTWVTIMADGRQEPDITLNPEEERTWSAQERFVLWTGNAGGIEVYFNGELQPPLGKPGEVRKEIVFERQEPITEPQMPPTAAGTPGA